MSGASTDGEHLSLVEDMQADFREAADLVALERPKTPGYCSNAKVFETLAI